METKELVTSIIKELVDNPATVSIKPITSGSLTIFEIHVDKGDVGKILGKEGRMIMSIRNIVNAIGTKNKKRYLLEVPNA